MSPTLGPAFTTTVRVIVRIHRRTANVWPPTLPPISSRFADSNRVVIRISNFTNDSSALTWHPPNFTTRKLQLRPT
jgi:hypothetical protein